MSTVKDVTKKEVNVDDQKRSFMKKFGKYAVVGAGMATLMTPTFSTAGNYKVSGNNGWGNGDDLAPGGSLDNNNAENGGKPGSNPN